MMVCQEGIMSPQVTSPIDKPSMPMDHRGILSRASGRSHRRITRGKHLCKGSIMVQVVNSGETFAIRLACTLCGERCRRLDELWLAFPPGEAVQGQWVHRACVSGRVESAFGTKRVVLMNGFEALRRVAQSLQDVDDDPALARQRPRVRAKVSG
jgi:hypothetical protein